MQIQAARETRNVPPSPPQAARWAVTAIFLVNGIVLSNWVARIPAVQDRLDLSEGQLGLALLGPAIGAIIAMPVTGILTSRLGSQPVTLAGTVLFSLALILPSVAVNLWTLLLGLIVFGFGNGLLDVAMNAQGVAVERRFERTIMSSFHAAFSFGGLLGAGMAALAVALGLSARVHFTIVAVTFAVLGALASRWLLPASADRVRRAHGSARRAGEGFLHRLRGLPTRLLLIGLVGFCCLVGEGAMADWTAVYLRSDLGTSEAFATAGYAAFSLAMAIGRLGGDWLAINWGPVAVVRRGGLTVAAALAVGLLVNHPLAAVIAFGAVGAGLSSIIPVAFSAAGQARGIAPGPAIATVSSLSYTGFLAGPPIIGFVAEVVGLRLALGFVVLMGAVMALLADNVAPEAAGATESATPATQP